jgi:hypothetical protein
MNLFNALRPFVAPRIGHGPARKCEICTAPLEADHPHLADVEDRTVACACRRCALLFAQAGVASARWRTVPDRHLYDAAFVLTEVEWEALAIPVSMAFFFKSSATGRWSAVYPSPAGPVESLLRFESWEPIASRAVLATALEWDVEALLITPAGTRGYECMLVPIHACYALVGQVRRLWRGLDGGEEARRVIADHVGDLHSRCAAPDGVRS